MKTKKTKNPMQSSTLMQVFSVLSLMVVSSPLEMCSLAVADQGTRAVAEQGSSITTSESSAWDVLKRKTSIGYYGIYYGPSVSHMDSSFQPNEYGKVTKAPQYFLNYLMLGYKASPDVTTGVVVMSTYTPVRGHDLTLLDPYLRLTNAKFVHSGSFNLYSELRLFLPATRESHNAHKLGTLGTFQAVTYGIAGTPVTVGTWAKLYWSAYGDGATKGTNLQAYFRPDLFYKISSKISAAIYYEMFTNHLLNAAWNDWSAPSSWATDLQLGAMWDVVPGLTLNPYLQFAPGGKPGVDSTAIGAQIFATLL